MVFSGQGQQHVDMLAMRESWPLFGAWIDRIVALFSSVSNGRNLLEDLKKPGGVNATDVCQPAIFACQVFCPITQTNFYRCTLNLASNQVALFEVFRASGITPSAIVGHSVGEVAAAYAAGVFGLEECVTLIYHRSTLQVLFCNSMCTLSTQSLFWGKMATGRPARALEQWYKSVRRQTKSLHCCTDYRVQPSISPATTAPTMLWWRVKRLPWTLLSAAPKSKATESRS
jgi:acyl transferase domain-containing protein